MMTDTTGSYPPLDGLVVLDLSRVLAGPYAAMLLGDLGARVIKVEHTKLGEIRLPGPPIQFGRSTSRQHTAPPLLDEHGEEIRQWAKTSEPTEAASDHSAGG